jgi:hypothetical protein
MGMIGVLLWVTVMQDERRYLLEVPLLCVMGVDMYAVWVV